MTKVKQLLEEINSLKTEGIKVRAKAMDVEYNEKSSNYFLNVEKRNANIKNITRLECANNTCTTDQTEILKELANFYGKLYSESIVDENLNDNFFDSNFPTLSKDEQDRCDNILAVWEFKKALDDMKPNKSPGTDGLNVEFYQHFWDEVKDFLFLSMQAAFDRHSLSND